ncbi:MAG TPA: hypothetical protein VLI94_04050 [Solirubrobacterales bacterium]|nr:hypothetical protein [Solirubrobacterales bacterium]
MRTPGNKTFLLLLGALAALVIAGCGGGGDETETTAPTVEEPAALSKEELIAEGDDVCAEVNAAVAALTASAASEDFPTEEAEKVANLYTGMVERLQDLGSPADDDGSYAKFMEAAEELAKVEGEVKLAAEREDLEVIGELNGEAEVALEEFQSQAEIYGFEDCSEGPGEAPAPAGGEVEPGGEEFEGEEGGVEVEPEFEEEELVPEEEALPEEEIAPETGGAGGTEEPAPEPETGGESGGVGPG